MPFIKTEREILLGIKGVGPIVVGRLEERRPAYLRA